MSLIVILLLIVLLAGGLPVFPYSQGWGYGPSGAVGVILLIVVVLALTGRL
jgi:hypothetical protein